VSDALFRKKGFGARVTLRLSERELAALKELAEAREEDLTSVIREAIGAYSRSFGEGKLPWWNNSRSLCNGRPSKWGNPISVIDPQGIDFLGADSEKLTANAVSVGPTCATARPRSCATSAS
jgi:hypothetical protein